MYKIQVIVRVNCFEKYQRIIDIFQEDVFDDIITTNLKGTFLVNRIAARGMLETNVSDGSIINISSVSGKLDILLPCQ